MGEDGGESGETLELPVNGGRLVLVRLVIARPMLDQPSTINPFEFRISSFEFSPSLSAGRSNW